jgi:lysophospholipase L1-like esterase
VTRFLAFGDSLTEGQSASVASRPMMLAPVTSYPSMLERDLRALYSVQDVRVVNSGRSGEWAEDGVYRLAGELRTAGPDAVLLLEGVNDLSALGTPVMQPTLDALDYMVQLCRQQRAAVYLATLPPQRPGGVRADAASLVPAFNEGLRRIARNRGAVLVDLEAAFGTDDSLLSEDGLHPNVAGYQVMAQAFLAAIRATLEKPAATTRTAAAAQTH